MKQSKSQILFDTVLLLKHNVCAVISRLQYYDVLGKNKYAHRFKYKKITGK